MFPFKSFLIFLGRTTAHLLSHANLLWSCWAESRPIYFPTQISISVRNPYNWFDQRGGIRLALSTTVVNQPPRPPAAPRFCPASTAPYIKNEHQNFARKPHRVRAPATLESRNSRRCSNRLVLQMPRSSTAPSSPPPKNLIGSIDVSYLTLHLREWY